MFEPDIPFEDFVDSEKLDISVHLYGIAIKNNKVLISPQYDGYDFPGGTSKKGETHIETLIREVKEETGYIVEPIQLLNVYTSFFHHKKKNKDYQSYLIYYLVKIIDGEISDEGFDEDEKEYAIHGYQPLLKGKEINENVGFIGDDGKNRLYTTSDTICFKNDYKADILCIPVTGHGLTMSAFEAALYSKEVEAKLTIPIHMDNPSFPPDFDYIKEMFEKYEVKYKILENDENIEI